MQRTALRSAADAERSPAWVSIVHGVSVACCSLMATDDRFTVLAAFIASSKRASFGHGTRTDIIADAEMHLGMPFPPSYRWWLAKYGAGYLGGYELQGLFPESIADRDLDLPLVGDIVDRARQNAVALLYPLHLLEILSYEG